ncbi:hypothetical protein D3C83_82320 [compost metagenome]
MQAITSATKITSQYTSTAKMSVVSLWMPPCLRKPSMPARSLSTLKLMARNPRLTVKRARRASAQPASSTTRASPSLGRNTPTCVSVARIGSSITLMSIGSSRF